MIRSVLAPLVALTLCASPSLVAQTPASPPGDSLRLRVDGMVCSLCAFGVERRLKRIEPVEQVHVDLDSGLVVVLLRPGAAVPDSILRAEVRRAGFTLRAVSRFDRGPRAGGRR
jgi:mercuric ion binding protein